MAYLVLDLELAWNLQENAYSGQSPASREPVPEEESKMYRVDA